MSEGQLVNVAGNSGPGGHIPAAADSGDEAERRPSRVLLYVAVAFVAGMAGVGVAALPMVPWQDLIRLQF